MSERQLDLIFLYPANFGGYFDAGQVFIKKILVNIVF